MIILAENIFKRKRNTKMAKQHYNYIKQMEDQRGESWIVSLRPEDIQNASKRIVKDMVKGTINYDSQGYAFLDSKFLENLFIGVSNELEINTLYYNACIYYQQAFPTTPNLQSAIAHLQRLNEIYNTIYYRLCEVRATGNIGCLVDITSLLYNYRHHLN
jgi:hypothetical protein